ncbi:MAG: sensor histidine kinase [Blautia sp.]|nr:sensor histidine kinase [Blautia sp.]
MKQKKRLTISGRMYISVLLLIVLTILSTGGICLNYALKIKNADQDVVITDFAEMVACMPEVRDMLKKGKSDPQLCAQLDMLTSCISNLDIIVICDGQSRRFYHTKHDRIGDTFIGNDETEILKGALPYISVATGTLGLQRRAFHGVTGEDGEILGFVMASVLQGNIKLFRRRIISSFFIALSVMIGLGILIADLYRKRLEKILLGYRPEEFVDLYIEREEVMNALDEGLFAIDTEGRVILMNYSAKRMLDLNPEENTEGKLLSGYYPETRLVNTVHTGIAEHDIHFTIKGRNIISSRIPVKRNGKIIGAVSIFRNKTEMTKLAEELTGAKYMVDTLRAVNHEFMNKLHVILGLLEMQEIEQAKDYILHTSLASSQAVSDIHHRVPIASLAALLIGKLLRANELGITFVVKQDSYFESKIEALPVDSFITLVGNLVENAMDELNSHDYPVKRIELGIYTEEGHTTIVCDDTGGGISDEILFSIYDPHTTTKGEGHGNGYALMKKIIDRYEGTIHIDTEPGMGTSVEIILPV